jgi:site-specific DNA recombinase
MTERAVLYARVSGYDRGKPGDNLAGQIEMCREYAQEQGYEIVAELSEDDRGVSGAAWDPEQLTRARQMASNREFDVLIVRELDRFARDLAKQLVIENEFRKKGVTVEYVLADYDETPEGDLQKHVRAVIAEYEKKKIAERTTRGRFNFVKRGNVLGHGKAPFGYRLVDTDDRRALEIHESEAKTVRLIFNLYVEEGMSIRGITKKLSDLRIPTAHDTRGGYKINDYGVWHKGSVGRILNMETYAGLWHYGKRRYKDGKLVSNAPEHRVAVEVPAIIDQETWKAAQERRQANRHSARNRQKYQYLLTGHLTCGDCGLALGGRTVKDKGKLYQYYYCPAKVDHSPRECNLPYFNAKRVNTAVWDWLTIWLTNESYLRRGLKRYQAKQDQLNEPLRERLETVRSLLADNQSKMDRLVSLFVEGDIPRNMLVERKERLAQAIGSLEKEEAKLQATLASRSMTDQEIDTIVDFGTKITRGLQNAERDFEVKERVVEALHVQVKLVVESDEKVAYLSCYLGKKRLVVGSYTS